MNDNEETRSYNELEIAIRRLEADNHMLRTQLAQARATIADYERAHAVAEAMAANNDKLGSTDQSQKNNAFLEQQGEYLKDELGQERASKIRNRLLGRTRVYRAQGEVVEVDVEFGRWMFNAGTAHQFNADGIHRSSRKVMEGAIEQWKERQAKS